MGILFKASWTECVRTHLCMHSNTAAQDPSNPYSRPGNKGRNIIYLIHIPIRISALEVFHGHGSDWTQADDFSLLVRKQDKKIQFVFCLQNEERDMSMSETKKKSVPL